MSATELAFAGSYSPLNIEYNEKQFAGMVDKKLVEITRTNHANQKSIFKRVASLFNMSYDKKENNAVLLGELHHELPPVSDSLSMLHAMGINYRDGY